jgi:hypothetical protein
LRPSRNRRAIARAAQSQQASDVVHLLASREQSDSTIGGTHVHLIDSL